MYISAWHFSIEGLPVAAGQTQHSAAYICTWHIIMVSPPDAALAQHTAAYMRGTSLWRARLSSQGKHSILQRDEAYINTWHAIMVSPPDAELRRSQTFFLQIFQHARFFGPMWVHVFRVLSLISHVYIQGVLCTPFTMA